MWITKTGSSKPDEISDDGWLHGIKTCFWQKNDQQTYHLLSKWFANDVSYDLWVCYGNIIEWVSSTKDHEN